jgi:hypothetical protein
MTRSDVEYHLRKNLSILAKDRHYFTISFLGHDGKWCNFATNIVVKSKLVLAKLFKLFLRWHRKCCDCIAYGGWMVSKKFEFFLLILQIPEFDNLYLDMNGIIHPCSHPNDDDPHFRITEEQIFSNIFHYIEVYHALILQCCNRVRWLID